MQGRAALTAAGAAAPRAAGVYLFLGAERDLLYVGKAGDLRQRLNQHAASGPATSHLHRRYDDVREVRWELAADEESAAWREADLIDALRPPFNAETNGRSAHFMRRRPAPFLVVSDGAMPGMLRFALSAEVSVGGERSYGCFPHLGKGVASRLGVTCSDGYVALLRLLWAASGSGSTMPAPLARSAPDRIEVGLDGQHARALHDLLSGVSARLLDALSSAGLTRPAFMHPALRRDRELALAFYAAGPRRLRDLRRRHGRPAGPISWDDHRALVAAEIRESVGPFTCEAPG